MIRLQPEFRMDKIALSIYFAVSSNGWTAAFGAVYSWFDSKPRSISNI